MFQSFAEFLGQVSEASELPEKQEAAEPVEPNVSEDGEQDIDWSAALEQSVNAVWGNASDTESVVEELDELEDSEDDDDGWDEEDELESNESEEFEEIDESDKFANKLTVSTGVDITDSEADDTEGLWDLLLESFGEPVEEKKGRVISRYERAGTAKADGRHAGCLAICCAGIFADKYRGGEYSYRGATVSESGCDST